MTIITTEYETVHRRQPRGNGLWFFWLEGGEKFVGYATHAGEQQRTLYSACGTFGSALRLAKIAAKQQGAYRIRVCA